MNQAARPAGNQRQSGRDERVVGRVEADFLGEREAQHHPRLGIVRQWALGRAVDQIVEVGQAAEDFAGDRQRQRLVVRRQARTARGSGVERHPGAQHRVEHVQRRLARGEAGLGLSALGIDHPSNSMCRGMKRPKHLDPPATHVALAPVPEPQAVERRRAARRSRRSRLDPTRYGDWEKKGIAVDF